MDECEGDESCVHGIEFVVTGENAPVSFQAAEQPLDLVSLFVDLFVVFPFILAVFLGGPLA